MNRRVRDWWHEFDGWRGTVFGAILGALIMASLDNGMSLKNVEPYCRIF